MNTSTPTDPIPEDKRTRCEVWTRVMGYHRPISQANAGKQAEFAERQEFRVENSEHSEV